MTDGLLVYLFRPCSRGQVTNSNARIVQFSGSVPTGVVLKIITSEMQDIKGASVNSHSQSHLILSQPWDPGPMTVRQSSIPAFKQASRQLEFDVHLSVGVRFVRPNYIVL